MRVAAPSGPSGSMPEPRGSRTGGKRHGKEGNQGRLGTRVARPQAAPLRILQGYRGARGRIAIAVSRTRRPDHPDGRRLRQRPGTDAGARASGGVQLLDFRRGRQADGVLAGRCPQASRPHRARGDRVCRQRRRLLRLPGRRGFRGEAFVRTFRGGRHPLAALRQKEGEAHRRRGVASEVDTEHLHGERRRMDGRAVRRGAAAGGYESERGRGAA